MLSVPLAKLFRLKDGVAEGLAIGTSTHAVGTAKAMEMGELQGAMSGLAMGIAAVVTVFLVQFVYLII
jgi:putative effector of murein hydrolase